jgi:hypothetical protein
VVGKDGGGASGWKSGMTRGGPAWAEGRWDMGREEWAELTMGNRKTFSNFEIRIWIKNQRFQILLNQI